MNRVRKMAQTAFYTGLVCAYFGGVLMWSCYEDWKMRRTKGKRR